MDPEGVLAVLAHEHLRVRREGRLLPKIHDGGGAVRKADHHEAAPADVPRRGVRHRQRESGGDRGVDGVAPGPQHLRSRAARVGVGRNDHPRAGVDRPPRK